jgi:hypothetical protein
MRNLFFLLNTLIFSYGTVIGAEIKVTDFSSWQKRGTLCLKKQRDVTVIDGEMQGGEIRTAIPAAQLKKYPYAVIERKKQQGPWKFICVNTNETVLPLDSKTIKLNFALKPEMARGESKVTFAIRVAPGATLDIKSLIWSSKIIKSGRLVCRTASGPARFFDTPKGRFTIPAKFEDVTPPVRRESYKPVSGADDSGLRSYVVDNIMELNPKLRPSKAEFKRRLALFAAPGQTEGAAFSIYAAKDAGAVKIHATNAVSASGSKLEEPEIRMLRVWPQRIQFYSLKYREVPELLEKNRPFDLNADTAQAFYLKIKVPKGAKPGIYRGSIYFSCGGFPKRILPYSVRVTELQLAQDFHRTLGVYYGNEKNFEMLRSFGFNSLIKGYQNCMYGILQPLDDIARKETDVKERLKKLYAGKKLPALKFDGSSSRSLDNFLKAYRAAGFRRLVIWIVSDGFTGRMARFLKLPLNKNKTLASYPAKITPEYRKLFKDCIRAITDYARKYGVELYWYQFDEIGVNSQTEAFAYAIEMFKLVKEAGGRTIISCAEDEFTDMVSPYLDTRLYQQSYGQDQTLKRILKSTQKARAEFFSYGNGTVEKPYSKRYDAGFNMFACDWQGKYFWNLHSQRKEQFNDFDHPQKDSMMIYSINGEIIPTLQLEFIRQGIDDFRYIVTVQQLVQKALNSSHPQVRAAGLKVKKELDTIKKNIPYLYSPDNWDFRNFTRYRWRLSNLGIYLQKMLDGRIASPKIKFYRSNAPQKSVGNFPDILKAPKTTGRIVIDGELSDSGWKQAYMVPGLRLPSGKKPEVPTEIKLTRDSKYLYLGIRCSEPDTSKLVLNQKVRDHLVWRDDCMEIFYDNNLDHRSYKQIIINPLGNVADLAFDGKRSDFKWNCPGLKVAAKIGRHEWRAEVAIPLKEFKSPLIGINFMRSRIYYLSHVALSHPVHSPYNYSNLAIAEMSKLSLAPPVKPLLGKNFVTLNAENDAKLQIMLNGKPAGGGDLKAGTVKQFGFNFNRCGINKVQYRVKTSRLREIVWRFTEHLPTPLTIKKLPYYVFEDEKQITVSGRINMHLIPKNKVELELAVKRAGSELFRSRVSVEGNSFDFYVPLADLLPEAEYELCFCLLGKSSLPLGSEKQNFYLMKSFNDTQIVN